MTSARRRCGACAFFSTNPLIPSLCLLPPSNTTKSRRPYEDANWVVRSAFRTFDEPNDNEITPRVAVTKFQPRMEEADDPEKPNKRSQGPPDEADATPSKAKEEEDDQQQQQAKAGGKEKKRRKQGGAVDPLNWYGVLVPGQLRAAQAEFAAAVEGPVPRLSALRAEMREVEAEVGRARKAIRKGLGGGKG